jgi:hypothetical protein
MNKTPLLATLLGAAVSAFCYGPCRADEPAPETRLADLLKLPDAEHYKVDLYIVAARSLQAMGKDKACGLLAELAAKDEDPNTRTVILCRMLFTAKRGEEFRAAMSGEPVILGGTQPSDWPLEPVALVDGVPFLVTWGYRLGGRAESSTQYLYYCTHECDWNESSYQPKTREEVRKALDALLSSAKLKGKLKDYEKDFLAAQIR